MANALLHSFTVVHIISWPISKLINAVLFVLKPVSRAVVFLLSPIWIVGSFLLLPFVHLARGLYNVVTLPLQVKWLERIETLYIYLGTAALIGCMTGAILYFIFNFLTSSLSIDTTSTIKPRRGRTAAEFRSTQREKKGELSADLSPPNRVLSDKAPGSRRRGLLSQTILEEEDSDF